MVAVKVTKNTYGGDSYLYRACEYVMNPNRALNVGGHGVSTYNVADAYNQMMRTKEYFGNTSGNPLVHIVVSYDDTVKTAEEACNMSGKVAEYFNHDYQNIYCTHAKERSCSNYHTHILLNSVSYVNGKKYDTNPIEMNKFCKFVSNVTERKIKLYFEKNN